MKFIYVIILKFILLFSVKGKLDLHLFQNLVDIDIQFINIYKEKIKEKYVKNYDTLVYENISKNINLKKNYVETTIKGNLKNLNEDSVEKFIFLLPYHEAFQATSLHVKDENKNNLNYEILNDIEDIELIDIDQFNYDFNIELFKVKIYEIILYKKLKKDEKVQVEFFYILGQPYYPFPIDINLLEKQNVLFYLSSKILLPYEVEESEETKINMCKKCTIVKIDDEHFMRGFQKLSDGTYVNEKKNNLRSFSLGNKVLFYFILDHNLGYFEKVIKNIKISHLGFVYEKEEYFLKNNSARINKFDRYLLSDIENKYTLEESKEKESSIIYSFESLINYNIYEYNYYDDLGNIYLIKGEEIYDKKKKKNNIKFDLKPRYPLLGNWKAHFYNSFSHHSNIFKIKNKKNYYAYKIDISPSIKSFYIKELNIKIALPLYSKDIAINKNYNLNIHTTKTKDWLDFFSFRNVIEIHVEKFFPKIDENYYQNFLVTYKFKLFNIFMKPLIIILIFFFIILFLFFIKKLSFNFNTTKEHLMKIEEDENRIFKKKCKELYENLSFISDKLIQSIDKLNSKDKIKLKERLLKMEEKWTYNFIYYTKEFQGNFENATRNKMLQNYIDKCFNYYSVVKNYFDIQLSGDTNADLSDIEYAEKELMLLLKYN
ncbi:dolichyl-diphosphooligosaccharide--protein glycosyltransferase subunit 1, putative [Plasmodium relictum]|uniref:Dolichyl-diphosphooligosaccharide--protein glycosyltransferase subunit 1 n=1 Tax=Plasmodium relictum TaxID=85471 RepID=A0A1J1H890_PLARL|nr:dolichyl-diphosphooligosaccharide--protein glycosyltransferase subunit 1, putative [Plasmodium relictum]CRG99813.1 dolichyl-diphosphooligosaccharide--protein glycosyltransferase subunit 1, putative [Plasmodium relictum]